MTRRLLRLHRSLGLTTLVFWLLQALTGTVLAFRWEIEDALLPGTAAAADLVALGARIEAIIHDGSRPGALWATADAATRFDIYYTDAAGADRVMRVDGAGRVLRDALDAGHFANGAVFDTLTLLHTRLLAGEAGSWVIAASGLALLVNLVVGLRLAWPAGGGWRRALFARPAGAPAARLYGWHRRLGLWLGLLILPFVVAGILLCFDHGLRERVDEEVPLPASSTEAVRVSPGTALAIAVAQYPGSKLSMIEMPADGEPWYRVRQRRPGDLSRNWGTSTLFVSAADGRILADHPSQTAPAGRKLIDMIYPFHTGQMAGTAGRVLVLIQGIWLFAMIMLGLQLWRTRRASR